MCQRVFPCCCSDESMTVAPAACVPLSTPCHRAADSRVFPPLAHFERVKSCFQSMKPPRKLGAAPTKDHNLTRAKNRSEMKVSRTFHLRLKEIPLIFFTFGKCEVSACIT